MKAARKPTVAQLRLLRRVRDERIVGVQITTSSIGRGPGIIVRMKNAFYPLNANGRPVGPEVDFRMVLRCEARGWIAQNPGSALTLTESGTALLEAAGPPEHVPGISWGADRT